MTLKAFAAAAVLLTASAPAFAGTIDLTTLTTAGVASTASGNLVLTPDNTTFSAGAGYLNQALALGGAASFEDTFSFSIASPATGPTANGFAFFLATSPAGIGTSSTNLGLTAASPLAVEFYDFANKNNPVNNGVYDSNLVAAIQNGSTVTKNNPTGSYGSPGPNGGVLSCVGKQTSGNDCMNNGDVWTADVKYIAGKLYVSVTDTASKDGPFMVINGYAISLAAGNYYTGFSGSTGGASDSVSLLAWSNGTPVPEPMTVGLLGAGLAALGLVRARRRSV